MSPRKISTVQEMHDNAMGGHNSDELLKRYVTNLSGIWDRKQALAGEEKDLLNQAKKDGFLKTSIKDALRELRMSEDQIQARREIEEARKYVTDLCRDLPIFKVAAEAA